MIRQAHTYMAGAMSGVTLIAAAIAIFVLLVSAQVFKNWPIQGLGGGGEVHVSDAREATSAAGSGQTGTTVAGTSAAHVNGVASNANGAGTRAHDVSTTTAGSGGTAPGGEGAAPANGGGGGGSEGSAPSQQPAASPGSGSGGGGSRGGGSSSTVTAPVTEAVNGTVNGVDEGALGGALHESGATEVTEGVVKGTVGPESPVGKALDETVDGTVEAVGGLLNGSH